MTERWVSKRAQPYHDAHCMLCGSNYGILLGEPRVCSPSKCLACGSCQCSVNGLGRGQCSICYIGLLGMPWSRLGDRNCGYAGCSKPAIVRVDGQHPYRCAEHLERGKWAGYVAKQLATREERYRLVNDDRDRFPRLGAAA